MILAKFSSEICLFKPPKKCDSLRIENQTCSKNLEPYPGYIKFTVNLMNGTFNERPENLDTYSFRRELNRGREGKCIFSHSSGLQSWTKKEQLTPFPHKAMMKARRGKNAPFLASLKWGGGVVQMFHLFSPRL